MLVSALTGLGLKTLGEAMALRLSLGLRPVRLRFHSSEGRKIASVYQAGKVNSVAAEGDALVLEAELPERSIGRFSGNVE